MAITIKELIADQLGLDAGAACDEAHLTADLCADELDLVELLMALEESFELEIRDAAFDRLTHVEDIVEYDAAEKSAERKVGRGR